eukprot:g18349.t2
MRSTSELVTESSSSSAAKLQASAARRRRGTRRVSFTTSSDTNSSGGESGRLRPKRGVPTSNTRATSSGAQRRSRTVVTGSEGGGGYGNSRGAPVAPQPASSAMNASSSTDESGPLSVRYSSGGGSGRSRAAAQSAASRERMARFLPPRVNSSTRSDGSHREGGARAAALDGTTPSRSISRVEGETVGIASRPAPRLARPSSGPSGGGVSQLLIGEATRTPRSSLATIGESGSGGSSRSSSTGSSSTGSRFVPEYLRPTLSSAGKLGSGGGAGTKPRSSTASTAGTAACSSRASTDRASSTAVATVRKDTLEESSVDRDYSSSSSSSSSSSGVDMGALESLSSSSLGAAEEEQESEEEGADEKDKKIMEGRMGENSTDEYEMHLSETRNQDRLLQESEASSFLTEQPCNAAPEARSSCSPSSTSSSAHQIPVTRERVQETDSVALRTMKGPVTPLSPSPVPSEDGAAPAEVVLQTEDSAVFGSTEQPGLGLSGHPVPSASEMLSQSVREAEAIAEMLRRHDSAAVRSTEDLGKGLSGPLTTSLPSGSDMPSRSGKQVPALGEVPKQREDSTKQLGLGPSTPPSTSPLSISNGLPRSDQGEAALAEVPLHQNDSVSPQAMAAQQRGPTRSSVSPPTSSSGSSRSPPSSQSSRLPQTLSADCATLQLKMDGAVRERDAALEKGRQKVELLLREREERNDAIKMQAALRQRAEDEAALVGGRYESLHEHSERELMAAHRKAEEGAERARERHESLSEKTTVTPSATAAAEAAVAAAEAAATESAREAMNVEERMKGKLRAAEEKAEDEVRRVTDEELARFAQEAAHATKLAEEQRAAAVEEAEDLRRQLTTAESEGEAELARARKEAAVQQERHEEELVRCAQKAAHATRLAEEQRAAAVEEAEDLRRRLATAESEGAAEMAKVRDEAAVMKQKHQAELLCAAHEAAHATKLVEEQRAAAVEEEAEVLRQQLTTAESAREAEFARALQLDEHLAAAKTDMASMRQETTKVSTKLTLLQDHHKASVRKANDRIAALQERTWKLQEEMAAMAGRVGGADCRAAAAESRARFFASQLSATRPNEEEKNGEVGEEKDDFGKRDIDAIVKSAHATKNRADTSIVRCRESTALLQMVKDGLPEVKIAEDDHFRVFRARLQEIDDAADDRIARAEGRAAALDADNVHLRALLVGAEGNRDAAVEVPTRRGPIGEEEEREDEEAGNEEQVQLEEGATARDRRQRKMREEEEQEEEGKDEAENDEQDEFEEDKGTGKGEEGREELKDVKQYGAGRSCSWCPHQEAEMRRLDKEIEAARTRLMTADKARKKADARLRRIVAAEKERQRARKLQRRRATEGLGFIEAGTELIQGSRYNNASESASVGGVVVKEAWDVVASLDRRVASLEEWRDTTQAEQGASHQQRLAETNALLRLADDAREVATVFAGRWTDEAGGDRSGGCRRED